MNDSDYTRTSPLSAISLAAQPLLGLTIVWHPDSALVGMQFLGPNGDGVIALSRFSPNFHRIGANATPLGDNRVARIPLSVRRHSDDSVEVTVPASRMLVELNGRPLLHAAHLSPEEIERGAILCLGGCIVICIHWMRRIPKSNECAGILGVSEAAIAMRDLVIQAAALELPVLLLGETGTGKEVVAKAIHAVSKRSHLALVSVNMATLSETLAAADLFGAAKGAYTGAHYDRQGLFEEASGSTLFLDEIGDTPLTVQPMLLRTLETGEYRPLGGRTNQMSNARLIAATDQDLNAGSFNQPLLRRLEAFVIRIPPLRQRREDIGVLIVDFLDQWQRESGMKAELSASLVGQLCNFDWPGNIRQLLNVLRRAVIALQAGEIPSFGTLVAVSDVDRASAPSRSMSDAKGLAPAAKPRKKLSELNDDDIFCALVNSGWKIQGAAQELGISRPSFYKLLALHPKIRRPHSIPIEEIRCALATHSSNVEKSAALLHTPVEALRRHLRDLGLIS